jgi:hypothetical protein
LGATQRVMAAKLTGLSHKIAIQLELCHLRFSLQVVSPETFGYTLVQVLQTFQNQMLCHIKKTNTFAQLRRCPLTH